MRTFRVYIFRHGQTKFNQENKFTGSIDSKLTKTGIEDAKIVAERLKNKKFHIAFHTSLSRSIDTLKEVLIYHPECKKVICDDRMIERDYGILSGKTHYEVVREYGIKKYDSWHRGWSTRPPQGESFKDVEKRVKSFIEDLKRIILKEKANVAISAHGNSIRLFRKIMENLSIKETCSIYIPYDKVYEYIIKI
ncbi:MAG: histidine phosphatase family protein [Candidatus Pacearchaeota archaeon]